MAKIISKPFGPPIHKDWRIFEARLFVQGLHVQHLRDHGHEFAKGWAQRLELVPEPANPYDAHAIQVTGIYRHKIEGGTKTSRLEIGYVPRHVSEALVKTGLVSVVKPRLKYIGVSPKGYVDIEFEVLGPKEHKKKYLEFFDTKRNNGPASDEQREFAWFFGLTLPLEITFAEAQPIINARISLLSKESPSRLLDWESYWSVCKDMSDEYICQNSFWVRLKPVDRQIFRETIESLLNDGKSLPEIAKGYYTTFIDLLLANHPQLALPA